MEFALVIPIIALGGLYVANNSNKKEHFHNLRQNQPPRENEIRNYPVVNKSDIANDVNAYPNSHTATDKYFNQNNYQERERAGLPVSGQIPEIYSLSGNYIQSDQFTHNNMVPFTSNKPRGQIYNNNVAENILDTYTGSGTQSVKKTEQAPLFKPQDNVQWTYGTPNVSDFVQSRQNAANRNNMVKPFESIHVGPGLDKGYSSNGSDGFNSGMDSRDKWLPKTVDDLRVATNPKLEYNLDGFEGPAQTFIKNIGIEGKVEKNRPDTFSINTQDRWLTTTGAEKAPQMHPDFVVKPSVRNETTSYQQGTPNATLKTASYVPTVFEQAKRAQLNALDVGHSVSTAGPMQHQHHNNQMDSHINYENNRSINKPAQTFGSGFSSSIGAVIAPIMDVLKPSRKQEVTSNVRVYGNLSGEVPKNYILSKSDVPDITIKETTLYQPNGYINNQMVNSAYMVTDHQPIANQRDSTNYSEYLGASSAYGNRQYDAIQTNNDIKEQTVVASSRINTGNAKLINPTLNVSISKQEPVNNRLATPHSVIASGPSTQILGTSNMPKFVSEQQNMNRLDPSLLDAFKNNPYTHSLSSY